MVVSKKHKLYVGCALTESPEKFKDGIDKLKSALRSEGYEVFDFVGLVDGTPKDVYEWDVNLCIKNCDAFIAICDYPGIGLGFELGEAKNLKKPILALAQNDSRVTRLVLGLAEVEPNAQFERYGDIGTDVVPLVNKWLSQFIA